MRERVPKGQERVRILKISSLIRLTLVPRVLKLTLICRINFKYESQNRETEAKTILS